MLDGAPTHRPTAYFHYFRNVMFQIVEPIQHLSNSSSPLDNLYNSCSGNLEVFWKFQGNGLKHPGNLEKLTGIQSCLSSILA